MCVWKGPDARTILAGLDHLDGPSIREAPPHSRVRRIRPASEFFRNGGQAPLIAYRGATPARSFPPPKVVILPSTSEKKKSRNLPSTTTNYRRSTTSNLRYPPRLRLFLIISRTTSLVEPLNFTSPTRIIRNSALYESFLRFAPPLSTLITSWSRLRLSKITFTQPQSWRTSAHRIASA
jgi:hypothetical protein